MNNITAFKTYSYHNILTNNILSGARQMQMKNIPAMQIQRRCRVEMSLRVGGMLFQCKRKMCMPSRGLEFVGILIITSYSLSCT